MAYDYPTIVAGLVYDRTGPVNYGQADRNRVEYATGAMADLVNSYGYFCSVTIFTGWNYNTYEWNAALSVENMNRYLGNIKLIEAAFHKVSGVELPFTLEFIDWTAANALEAFLAGVYPLVLAMIENFRECGTFNCGEEA